MKMSHIYGGVAGGVAFGLIAGLLLGSCVFTSGPNHQAVALGQRGSGMGGGPAAPPDEGPAGGAGSVPGGMDPGAGIMDAVFARVAELKSRAEKNPKDRAALIDLANLYYDAGKFEQAIPYYEKALELHREDPNILTDTGNCYWQTGNAAKALALFQEAQRTAPSHWQSAANLFFLAASLGQVELASDALSSVRRVNPSFDKLPAMEQIYSNLKSGAGSP